MVEESGQNRACPQEEGTFVLDTRDSCGAPILEGGGAEPPSVSLRRRDNAAGTRSEKATTPQQQPPEASRDDGAAARVTSVVDLQDGRFRVGFEADYEGLYDVVLGEGSDAVVVGTVGVKAWLSCKSLLVE